MDSVFRVFIHFYQLPFFISRFEHQEVLDFLEIVIFSEKLEIPKKLNLNYESILHTIVHLKI